MRREIDRSVLVTEWNPPKSKVPFKTWMRDMMKRHDLKVIHLEHHGIAASSYHRWMRRWKPQDKTLRRLSSVLSRLTGLDCVELYKTLEGIEK